MAFSDSRFAGVKRRAGMALAIGLFAGAAAMAMAPVAQAAPDHRFHGGHGGPAFHGRAGFHGRGFHGAGMRGRGFYGYGPGRGWYGRGVGWYRRYPPLFPGYGYYGTPFVRYYYPQYVYPAYVMPTAVYVLPPRPQPPIVAIAPAPRDYTVYFDFDRYDLTHEGRRVVDAAIAAAQAGGPARIDVTGNTDLAGTNRYNIVLSRRRAETVRNYMIARGVDAGEIAIDARGKSDPAVRTADGVREPRNRRVEIVITPMGERWNAPPATSMRDRQRHAMPVVPANATMAPPPPPGNPPPPPVGQPTNLINQ